MTTCESLAVRYTLFFCKRATCVKYPDRIHFLTTVVFTFIGASSLKVIYNLSRIVLSWSRTSKAERRCLWLRKFLKHQSTSWFFRRYSKKAFIKVKWSPYWLTNLPWASLASPCLSLGRRNILGELRQATIVTISLTQLYLGELRRTLDSWGSRGNSAMRSPYGVRLPSSSKAPK